MNRELKFRVWYGKEFVYFKLGETNKYPSNVMQFPVQQFIGRVDKNGKDIYEGDILKGFNVVKWFEQLTWDSGGSNHPGHYCEQWLEYGEELSYHDRFDDDSEVIGNIYETPELIPRAVGG